VCFFLFFFFGGGGGGGGGGGSLVGFFPGLLPEVVDGGLKRGCF